MWLLSVQWCPNMSCGLCGQTIVILSADVVPELNNHQSIVLLFFFWAKPTWFVAFIAQMTNSTPCMILSHWEILGAHADLSQQWTLIDSLNHLSTELILGNMKMHLHLLSFVNIDMVQVVEVLPHGRQGPVYLAESISGLSMPLWHMEPAH